MPRTPDEERAYHTARKAAWRRDNPDRAKATARRDGRKHRAKYAQSEAHRAKAVTAHRKYRYQKYGITLADYDIMLKAQGGVCAICGKPSEAGKRLHVDHCHDTKQARGLLCVCCNVGIGGLSDDPSVVMAAYRYLVAAGRSSI